jgi:ABC-type lipoprotein export system ATPase subunit
VFAVGSGVSRRFPSPTGDVVALDDVTVAVRRGELAVIAGPSGSGKSTLLAMFAALDLPDAGHVEVDGCPITRLTRRQRRAWRRRHVGIVLPQPSDNLTERVDAAGNVRWALRLRGRDAGPSPDGDLLEQLGLADAAAAELHELSMGQQMRLAFACAAVGSPPLIVADEPTASLDAAAGATLVEAVVQLAGAGTTVLVATHDPAVIDAADHLVRLDHGRRVG